MSLRSRIANGPAPAQIAALAGLASVAIIWFVQPILGGDTPGLINGAEALVECLADRNFVACGFTPERTGDGYLTTIGPWPVLQYPLVLVADVLGATVEQRVELLVIWSILAFGWSVAVTNAVLRRTGAEEWIWGVLLVMLSGPLLVYANASWGEMVSSGLLVLLVAATVLRLHPALIGFAACAAALTKETSYPFIVAVGLLGLWLGRRRASRSVVPQLAWGAAGLGAGIACATAFNILRYGSLLNTNQLQAEFRAASLQQVLESGAGLLIAPNGGILLFWPSATVLLAVVTAVPLWRLVRGRVQLRCAAPALVILACMAGLLGGFASWASPFGWFAWGPRLTLPWVWPLLLLGVVAYGTTLRDPVARFLASGLRLAATGLILVVSTLPHIGFLWRTETTREFFFAQTEACDSASELGSAERYECLHEQMWLRDPILLDALPGILTVGGVLTVIAVVGAQLGCLVLLRDSLLRSRAV